MDDVTDQHLAMASDPLLGPAVDGPVTDRPAGSEAIVTCKAWMKKAESRIGAPMTTEAGFAVPVYEPAPLPLHKLKAYRTSGAAVIETTLALSCQSLAGITVPPTPAAAVR